jgi:hypothetical protein
MGRLSIWVSSSALSPTSFKSPRADIDIGYRRGFDEIRPKKRNAFGEMPVVNGALDNRGHCRS